jgi:hypothetical protein
VGTGFAHNAITQRLRPFPMTAKKPENALALFNIQLDITIDSVHASATERNLKKSGNTVQSVTRFL